MITKPSDWKAEESESAINAETIIDFVSLALQSTSLDDEERETVIAAVEDSLGNHSGEVVLWEDLDGYAVLEEYTDKANSDLRRVFVGPDALDNAERFVEEHAGYYHIESVETMFDYQGKN